MKRIFTFSAVVMMMAMLFAAPAYAMCGWGYNRSYAQEYTVPNADNLEYRPYNGGYGGFCGGYGGYYNR